MTGKGRFDTERLARSQIGLTLRQCNAASVKDCRFAMALRKC
jgi:hypothetical protein